MADEYTENLKFSVARMGWLALCMQDFSAQIIRHVLAGGILDDEAFNSLKITCILNLKNSSMLGLPIGQEAEIFKTAVTDLEQFIDSTIAMGRK